MLSSTVHGEFFLLCGAELGHTRRTKEKNRLAITILFHEKVYTDLFIVTLQKYFNVSLYMNSNPGQKR